MSNVPNARDNSSLHLPENFGKANIERFRNNILHFPRKKNKYQKNPQLFLDSMPFLPAWFTAGVSRLHSYLDKIIRLGTFHFWK